jgi:diamine N-acetyltransferase
MDERKEQHPTIHLERITAETVREICDLSDTLTPQQRTMVADNSVSIAQAHSSDHAWFRAIYAHDTPIGFVMLHISSEDADRVDSPGVFLWRFMIAGPYQGKGYGREALKLLVEHVKALGFGELYTSYRGVEGGPEGFYQAFGFVPRGEIHGEEIEAVYRIGPTESQPPQRSST